MIGYLAGGLGVLSFVWGFLDWYSADSGPGLPGYAVGSGGAVCIGLSLVAGLAAAARVFERKQPSALPAVIGVAALLVTLGQLVDKGDQFNGIGVGIGLILELITTIVQAAALVYLWLLATGRIAAPTHRGPQSPPLGYSPSAYPPPPGYGAPPSPPSAYGPPTTQFPPQQPAPSQQPTPSYSPPPQSGPAYGSPGGGYAPPPPPPRPAQPPAPGSGGETTTWQQSTFRPPEQGDQR